MIDMERQFRMLLAAIDKAELPKPGEYPLICSDVTCVNSLNHPHMAEQPYGCPRREG